MAESVAEPAPKPKQPRALQFIKINEKGDSFVLEEDAFREVLDAVPENMPISVVCVVGAFRTGKSFILDLFLRYLRKTSDPDANLRTEDVEATKAHEEWLMAEGTHLEAMVDEKDQQQSEVKQAGFSWRPGNVRNTTGMWIWSEPFIRYNPLYVAGDSSEPEKVAVLLVDTQGMFDMLTTQMLTAAIFGLSTFISSYLIYNVDKRIGEDNLQHLALFTDYGRIALQAMEEENPSSKHKQPFQTLEFLIRDFQDYDDEDDVDACVESMGPYLERILESSNRDTSEVRDQINICFEKLGVFGLTHPGKQVPKPKYNGDLSCVEPSFCALVHRLATRVFGTNSARPTAKELEHEAGAVVKKRIAERYITSADLFEYVRQFVKVFHDSLNGDGVFPEAKTLLAAAAEANNYNAMEANLASYKKAMDLVCGVKQPYVALGKIEESHKEYLKLALLHFDRIATMGSKDRIAEFRDKLELKITEMKEDYIANNANKRPDILRFITILLMISSLVYLSSSMLNIFCWPPQTLGFDFEYADMCGGALSVMRDVYLTIFVFIVLTLLTSCWGSIGPLLQVALAGQQATPEKKNQ